MTARRKTVWRASLFLALLVGCSGLGYGCFVPRVTVGEIERRIEAALPVGSTKAAVEAWLRAQPDLSSFGHTGKIGTDRMVGFWAVIQDTGPRLDIGFRTKIRLDFHLDDQDLLERYEVREWTPSF